MRAIAILTMFLAWMLYGAMPALGACPMCDQSMPQTEMPGMDMAGMKMPMADAHHEDSVPRMDCLGHIAFCAFCLVMPPSAMVADDKNAVFSYPMPALAHPLRDARPAPASPPPRLT